MWVFSFDRCKALKPPVWGEGEGGVPFGQMLRVRKSSETTFIWDVPFRLGAKA